MYVLCNESLLPFSSTFVTRGYIKVSAVPNPNQATAEDTVGSVQGYIDPSAATVEDTIGSVRGYVEPSAATGQVTIPSKVPG